jgi:uridylate kinase
MDSTAFALCKDNGLPIIVFNLETDGDSGYGTIERAVMGEHVGTLVQAGLAAQFAGAAMTGRTEEENER